MKRDITTTLKLAGVLAILFLAYIFRDVLVQPPAVDPNHAFNTERAYSRLARILGDEAPHPVDSDANDAVIARLITEIETLGFQPIIRDEFHCIEQWRRLRCARLQNVAFWVTPPGPNAVLVLSHHDSVPAGPGASDDGAGVASSLEIASLMKAKTLKRPLLMLITDGEELGLMGANLFVEKDPLAKMVGAVVNMEARGVSGLSALIQTSRPNARDLKTLSGSTRLPAASSINADIYELLPNDTDMTEFLHLPVDAANLAYAGDVAFYHTPGDNLANMDKRALFSLGANGLAATETFLNQTGEEAESQLLYVDILGVFVLTLPILLGKIIIAIGGLLALALLWTLRKGTTLWRVTLVPLLALMVGTAFAIGTTLLVGFIRPETLFGAAYPIALRGLHASAALAGTMIIYTFMTRAGEAKALLGASWFWTAILAALAISQAEGAAILFAPPMILFVLASIAFLLKQSLPGFILAALGAGVFALLALPLTALGESGLFVENSAPFSVIIILLFAYIAPLIWPQDKALLRSFWLSLVGTIAVMSACLIASLLVPAYSKDTPRGVSITHIQSTNFEETVWSVSGNEKVPADMLSAAPFETGSLPVFGGPRQIAPATKIDADLSVNFIKNTVTDGIRNAEIAVLGADTDRFALSWSQETLTALSINGINIDNPDTVRNIMCSGRSCRNLTLTLSFPVEDEAFLIDILSSRFGLGAQGEALMAARPDWAIPRQLGDSRLQHLRINLSDSQ